MEEHPQARFKEAMKDGKWKAVKVLGKVATPIAVYFDCTSVCEPSTAIMHEGGLACRVGYRFLKGEKAKAILDATQATPRALCTVSSVFPGGQAICLACCACIKYIGIA